MIVVLVALIAVAGIALLAWILAAFYLAETLTRSKRGRVEGHPSDLLLRHEEIDLFAADGVRTRGWYFAAAEPRATVVLVHDAAGTRSDPRQGLLELQRDYVAHGVNVLSFDLRGRGESDGNHDYLGSAELADVERAMARAVSLGRGRPLLLHGFGMGASLALVAASHDPSVSAVIADSACTSMRSQLRHEHRHWPAALFGLAAVLARRFIRADIDAIVPIEAIPELRRPVLYIHAEHDPEVPVEHTLNLAAASLNAADRAWISHADERCGTYRADPAGYLARCLDFIDAVAAAPASAVSTP